jgi:hypothetical protein
MTTNCQPCDIGSIEGFDEGSVEKYSAKTSLY